MFTSRHMVRFDDVDGAGIVYYPRFFNFCHKTFEDLFNQRGPLKYSTLIKEQDIGFPTVHVHADFLKPFYYGDEIDISLGIKSMGNSSVNCVFILHNALTNEKHFKALITVVCARVSQKKSIPIPDELRNFLSKFPAKDE